MILKMITYGQFLVESINFESDSYIINFDGVAGKRKSEAKGLSTHLI
jgi:hypothetical protein